MLRRLTDAELRWVTGGTNTLNGVPVRIVWEASKDKYDTWTRCGGAGETRQGPNLGQTRYYIG